MTTVAQDVPPLIAGDHLTRQEFLERWEAMPGLKRAELIGGIVYLPSLWLQTNLRGEAVCMPSPVSNEHSLIDTHLAGWLTVYQAATPGIEPGSNATWLMCADAPQPDKHLRILSECGGHSQLEGKYTAGAPEFIAEVALSSRAYDLHQKLELYEEAGVDEYLAVLQPEQELRWHRLADQAYTLMPADADGIWRSQVFPGLWLDSAALWRHDSAQLLATLQRGLQSAEHAAFVALLAARRAGAAS